MIFSPFLDIYFQILEMYKISLHCFLIKIKSYLLQKETEICTIQIQASWHLGRDEHFPVYNLSVTPQFWQLQRTFYQFWKDDYRKDMYEAFFKDIMGCDLKKIIRSYCPKVSFPYLGPEISIIVIKDEKQHLNSSFK